MVSSECADVKSVGLQALTHLSAETSVRDVLIQHGGVDRFLSSLKRTNDDLDMHRCAVTGLAHLMTPTTAASTSTRNNSRESVWNSVFVPDVSSSLCRLLRSNSQHNQRQTIKFVLNLVNALGAGVLSAEVESAINDLGTANVSHTDPTARQCALHIMHTRARNYDKNGVAASPDGPAFRP